MVSHSKRREPEESKAEARDTPDVHSRRKGKEGDWQYVESLMYLNWAAMLSSPY